MADDPPPPTDVSLVFPPHPAWVRTARETVRTLLATSHRPELTDTALLLTSEAVTNAITACKLVGNLTPVTLYAGWSNPHNFRVLVHDEAPGLPTCRTPATTDEDGRGMQLIAYGADAWGVCAHGPGRGKATGSSWGTDAMDEELSVGTTATPDEAAERRKRALARLAARADYGDFDLLLDKKHRRRPHPDASASCPSPSP